VAEFSACHGFGREILSRRNTLSIRPNVFEAKTLLELEIHPIFIEALKGQKVNVNLLDADSRRILRDSMGKPDGLDVVFASK
jgi:hypothetical protein